jgi:hypothetical protein
MNRRPERSWRMRPFSKFLQPPAEACVRRGKIRLAFGNTSVERIMKRR